MAELRRLAPGALLVAAIALAGYALGRVVPVEASLLALLLGLLAGATLRQPKWAEPGSQLALKRALMFGVILLGAEVNLVFLLSTGPKALILALLLVPATLGVFWALARALRVERDEWALLGAGTAICGLSAVIATGATLRSRERDIAVGVASIGILSAVGLVLYPLVPLVLPLRPDVYGAWSGLSLHAVANAVAAGLAHGEAAGKVAALTKFARVAMLAPMLIVLALLLRRGARAESGGHSLLPPMVWGFLLVAAVVSIVPIPDAVLAPVKLATRALLLLGIAAIGVTTRLGHVRDAGPRVLALAVLGWIFLSAAALVGAWIAYG